MAGPWERFQTPDAQPVATGPWTKFQQQPQQDLSWSDVPGKALENAPQSAIRTAQAMVYPVLHPIDTAKALGNIAYGAGSKAAGAIGIEQDPQHKIENEAQIDAVGKFFKERYGSVEGLKKSLAEDPVGVATDLSVMLTGGAALPARAGGVVGKVGEAVGKVGSALDPLATTARVAKGAGKLASELVGLQSGVAGKNYRLAFEAGNKGGSAQEAFRDNMTGAASPSDVVDMAKSATSQIAKERSDAYKADMTGINANQAPLDFAPVSDAIKKSYDSIIYKGISKSDAAAKVYNDVLNTTLKFVDTPGTNTVEGFDALKQAIGEIRQKTEHGTLERKIANDAYQAVKSEIVRQVPDYAKAMRGYSQASEKLDDLSKTFSLGEKAATDTSVRKLSSALRNNVNTNFGRREELMNVLAQKQPDIPYSVAGMTLSSNMPRNMAGLLAGGIGSTAWAMQNPALLAALPFSSPRVMGEAANALGRGYGTAREIGNALRVDPMATKNALMSLYSLNQASQPALVGEQDVGPQTPEELKRKRKR